MHDPENRCQHIEHGQPVTAGLSSNFDFMIIRRPTRIVSDTFGRLPQSNVEDLDKLYQIMCAGGTAIFWPACPVLVCKEETLSS